MFGTIRAKFTWNPDGSGLPAPPIVLLHEWAAGYAVGETHSAGSGIPQTGGFVSELDELAEGERWEVLPNPGSVFYRNVEPSAFGDVPANSETVLMSAFAGVAYEVEARPARIKLDGVVHPVSDKRIITGQLLRATVVFSSPSSEENTKYTWQQPTAGKPFKDYIATTPLGDEIAYEVPPVTGPDSNKTEMYFNEEATVALSCGVELVDVGVSFTLDEVIFSKRSLVTIEWTPLHGDFYLLPLGAPDVLQFRNPGAPNGRTGGYTLKVKVEDPPNFDGARGNWNYAQLVTPSCWQRDEQGVPWNIDHFGQEGLDLVFPYPYALDQYENPLTKAFICTQAEPFSDSPGISLLPIPDPPTNPPTFPSTVKEVLYDAAFKLYVVYRPPANFSSATKWVSRYRFKWDCTGKALKTNGVWARTHNGGEHRTSEDWYEHPEWTFAHK